MGRNTTAHFATLRGLGYDGAIYANDLHTMVDNSRTGAIWIPGDLMKGAGEFIRCTTDIKSPSP